MSEYICHSCNSMFDTPLSYHETHGLDTPPYEKIRVCPICGSSEYDMTTVCDICDTIVAINEVHYIHNKDNVDIVCSKCYSNYEED